MARAKPVPEFRSDETFVYVLGIPGGPYKIGYSRMPRLRAMAARRDGRGPAGVVKEWSLPRYRLARAVEHYAHWLLREHHLENEWFNVTEAEALAAVEHALRPEAMDAYDEQEVIPSITLPRKGAELFSFRLARGTSDRIGAILGAPRGHADFIREAVEAELRRRERKPKPKDG